MERLDLIIFGTGPAATRIAPKCAEAGWRVGIVDPRPYGGTCALRGCNPKKVLVRAAELYDWIGRAEGTGVHAGDVRIDWTELIRFKRTFTAPVTRGKEDQFERMGITQYHGYPQFIAPNRITVGDREVEARNFVVATGAVPAKLDIPGEDLLTTSDEFLELESLPKRILFVGGGYVTFEFAHVAARAGANVTIVDVGERPLRKFDPDLVDCLVERSRELGIEVRTSTKVEGIVKSNDGILAVEVNAGDKKETLQADLVVHGAGRTPNTHGLGLDVGNIQYGAGGIEVTDFQQSVSNPAVYAAGDVAETAAPPLSPVASHEGRIVAKNLLEGNRHRCDYGAVPSVVFSVPALASVGLREDEAESRSFNYVVKAGDRKDDSSMKKVGETHARYKLIVEKATGKILGAHLLGPDAAETINLFALAMKHGLTAADMKATLFAFPTFGHDVRSML